MKRMQWIVAVARDAPQARDYTALAKGRTLSTSSLRRASRALAGTVVTAIVSPKAFNTSIE